MNFPGGSYPGWEFSGWELPWLGIFFGWGFSGWELSGGNHPGGNFPGGSFHVTQHFSVLDDFLYMFIGQGNYRKHLKALRNLRNRYPGLQKVEKAPMNGYFKTSKFDVTLYKSTN